MAYSRRPTTRNATRCASLAGGFLIAIAAASTAAHATGINSGVGSGGTGKRVDKDAPAIAVAPPMSAADLQRAAQAREKRLQELAARFPPRAASAPKKE